MEKQTWQEVYDIFYKTNLRFYSPELAEKYSKEDANKWIVVNVDDPRRSPDNFE